MVSLYIHIPFCRKKCLYCSFPVTVGAEHRIDAYLDGILFEMQRYKHAAVKTMYIGGGTPTCLHNDQIKRLIAAVREHFMYDAACEFTIETNPETLSRDNAQLLRDCGVNRLSIGIQSLHNNYLQYLGRNHDMPCALRAFDIARMAGFDNINVDLMYSFPGQTKKEIYDDVRAITALQSEHVSLYTLDVEKGSRFYVQKLQLQSDGARAEHYRYVAQLLERAGLRQYEISNFAKPGKESRHNSVYWQGGEYIGLGMGAHSYLNGTRSWNVSRLPRYLALTADGTSPVEEQETLDVEQRFREILLIHLRMNCGVDVVELEKRFGCTLDPATADTIQAYVREGFFTCEGPVLKATPKGRLVLDELCGRLL